MRSIDDFLRADQLPANTGIVPPHLRTGGGLPPVQVTATGTPIAMPPTGGPNQPVQYPAPVVMPPTGGPNQPVKVPQTVVMPPTGGPNQPVKTPTVGIPAPTPLPPTTPAPGNQFGPVQTVEQFVNQLMAGQYGQNARQRGLETANSRGLLNSAVAAGASERSALEAIQPLVNEGMGLLNAREDRALRQKLQNDQVVQQDWLNSNQYYREFNGNLSLIPIANSVEFMQYIMQMGAQEPEVFTPNILAGMQNFFSQSMNALLQQYLPKGGR